MAPLPPARCPPITLIGEAKGLPSATVWWVTAVHPVLHGPSGPSRPRSRLLDKQTINELHLSANINIETDRAPRFLEDLLPSPAGQRQSRKFRVNHMITGHRKAPDLQTLLSPQRLLPKALFYHTSRDVRERTE
ncbi:unnamed protein product [Boreogadus saida]